MTKILKKNLIYLLIGLLLISGLFILTKNNGITKANADYIDWNCYDGEDLPDKYENKIKSIQNNKGDVSYLKDNDKSNGREPTNLYFNETVGVSYNTLSYNEVTYTLNTQWNGREDKEGLRRYTFYLFSYNGEKLTPLEVVIVECIKDSYYKISGNWWTGYYTTQYRNLDINESHIFEDHYYFNDFSYLTVGISSSSGIDNFCTITANLYNSYNEYKLVMHYEEFLYSDSITSWFTTLKYFENTRETTLYLPLVSYAGVWENAINDELSCYTSLTDSQKTEVENLVYNPVVAEIKVQYLKQIGNSPFAERVTDTVSVTKRKNDNNVSSPVILTALKDKHGQDFTCSVFNCSYQIDYIDNEDNGVYRAIYDEAIKLQAKTEDGNLSNSNFLDINKSFADYFQPFIDNHLITTDHFAYIFNSGMYSQYPELQDYIESQPLENRFDNVYGYFFYLMIPKTHTLNTVLKYFTSTSTVKTGVLYEEHFDITINPKEYNVILQNYDYGAFERLWETFISENIASTNAVAYCLYADPYATKGGVFEDGNENPDDKGGVSGGIAKGFLSEVGDFISTTWNSVTDLFSNTSVVGTALLIVAGIIFIPKLINTFKGNKKK